MADIDINERGSRFMVRTAYLRSLGLPCDQGFQAQGRFALIEGGGE